MGKPDDSTPRSTREFDSARLAVLTKQPLADEAAPQHVEEATSAPVDAPAISVGRAPTVDDPMTTGLLAEVARRSQTLEFDGDSIQDTLAGIEAGDTHHPHTRRRTK